MNVLKNFLGSLLLKTFCTKPLKCENDNIMERTSQEETIMKRGDLLFIARAHEVIRSAATAHSK